MLYRRNYPSPLGPLLLCCTDSALTGLYLNTPEVPAQQHPLLEQAGRWLDAYFAGAPVPVFFPLAPAGTAFQQLIWQQLLEIPFGQTRSYGALAAQAARQLGKPRMSAQAVGGAVGRNPICIIIPCHRCIGAGGDLVGYAGGLENKAWLLRHEAQFSPFPPENFGHFAKS